MPFREMRRYTFIRVRGILFTISIFLVIPTHLHCQNACLGPETEGFGTREAYVAVDISKLTPNTAVDPEPTIRPTQVGCHPESMDINGRTVTWIADCHEMTTLDQRRAGKTTPDDFYSSRAGVFCREYLAAGVSFYRLPFLIFGRDAVDSQGTVRFMRYALRGTWVWYKADTNSFYLYPSYGLGPLYGPFKGEPLTELRKAIRPYRQLPLPGVTASVVSHFFGDAHKKPAETPPPESAQDMGRNYTPDMAWAERWVRWNSSQTTVRLTNNTGRVLYYSGSEEKKTEGGIYAYGPWGDRYKLESGQSVEWQIYNSGVRLPLSQCVRDKEYAESVAPTLAQRLATRTWYALNPCQTAPTRHIVVFVNADPALYDDMPIDITYTPPLRETLPPNAATSTECHFATPTNDLGASRSFIRSRTCWVQRALCLGSCTVAKIYSARPPIL